MRYLIIALALLFCSCATIREHNSDDYYHEITRYSDSGAIIEQFIYVSMTPDPVNRAIISFTRADTTYFMSENITIRRWKQ